MGHCKVKCGLCSVQQVWWSLHWGLWQGWAGGLWGLRFCWFVEIFEEEAALGNHSAQSQPSV